MQDDQKLTSGRTSAPERMRRGPRSLPPAPAGEADGHAHARTKEPCAGEDAALCRDTTYAGLVTAVRSAVERNAGFGA